jgi:hypothetical protein
MKQTYLIIGASITIVLLICIWAYLLIYGTPKPVENFFTDFSFSGSGEVIDDIPFIPLVDENIVDVADISPLRQLTTRPVIGFGEKIENNESIMLYAEAGIGHVYAINLNTGTETRLSNITIINSQSAQFSPDGQYVAIRSGYGSQNTIKLLTLAGENSATEETLSQSIVDFTFSDSNELLFTEYTNSGLIGRSLNPISKVVRNIFSVPFQSATIAWNTDGTAPHYVYPKSSTKLPGFLYSLKSGAVTRIDASGYGLNALANSKYIVYTRTVGQGVQSRTISLNSSESLALTVIAEPSKCVISKKDTDAMYCGYEKQTLRTEFPDNWYKGSVSFSDSLWEVSLSQGYSSQLINPATAVGREIDIINIDISTDGGVLYFNNKNDNTLWLYEI